jgi:hypothetical protein
MELDQLMELLTTEVARSKSARLTAADAVESSHKAIVLAQHLIDELERRCPSDRSSRQSDPGE